MLAGAADVDVLGGDAHGSAALGCSTRARLGVHALALDVGLLAQPLEEARVLLLHADREDLLVEARARVLVGERLEGTAVLQRQEVAAEVGADQWARPRVASGRARASAIQGARLLRVHPAHVAAELGFTAEMLRASEAKSAPAMIARGHAPRRRRPRPA